MAPILVTAAVSRTGSGPHTIPALVVPAERAFGQLPMMFEPNVGQASQGVQFVARGKGHTLLLTALEASMFLPDTSAPVRMKLIGANTHAHAQGEERMAGTSNYFIGNDPSRWYTKVPHFAKVRYRNVYPGVDVVYYGDGRNLEYDFVIAPGANPNVVELAFDGVDRIEEDSEGNAVLTAGSRRLVQHRPKIYQEFAGKRVEIAGSYRVSGTHVQFALADYDHRKQLVIDPTIQYTVYFGGSGYEAGTSIAVDANGSAYVTGVTNSISLRTSDSSAQPRIGGASDAFVAKFTAAGNDVLYITYLGGTDTEAGNTIVIDAAGNAYVSGFTTSMDFPIKSAAQQHYGGGGEDAFVAKISPGGDSLVYSTYVGGGSDDYGNGLAIDAQGNAYLTGWTRSTDFPVQNAFQPVLRREGGADVFVTKIAPAGNQFVYSTFVGGNGQDIGTGIAIDSTGAAYVTGATTSSVFPLKNAFQSTNGGPPLASSDAFVFKLSPDGSSLIYSTFLGGVSDDQGNRITVDSSGSAYVTGFTKSPNFPTLNAAQSTFGGTIDAFVTKLSPAGNTLVYSTFIGGSGEEQGFGQIALDSTGSAYVAGWTNSTNFPTRNAPQSSYGGGNFDAFVTRLAPAGNAFLYSTYIGGSGEDKAYGLALDPARGNVYITGQTTSPNMPAARNAITTGTAAGSDPTDVFITRLSADLAAAVAFANPTSLNFVASAAGGNPAPQTISLTSSGAALTFSAFGAADSGPNWISVDPSNGTTGAQDLTVRVNTSGLTAGNYTGTVTINLPSGANSPLIVPVKLTITASPVIGTISPASIFAGSPDTTITISGSGFASNVQAFVNGTPVPTTFVDANTLRAVIPAATLTSVGALQIALGVQGGALSRAVALNVTARGPFFTGAGLVNAATQLSGAVSPGEIVTIYGTGFGPAALAGGSIDANGIVGTSIAGTRVLFDGAPSPLLYVVQGQLSAVVPYSLAGRQSASVVIESNGQQSGPVTVAIVPTAPGVFSQDSSGKGPGAILNQDNSLNTASNPAAKGSVVTLYATGEGVTNPDGVSGLVAGSLPLPKPVQPVFVKIGGVDAIVTYAGAAPGLIAGAMQVNVVVPNGAPSGSSVPVVLQVGGVSSRFDVTMSIQ